MLTSLCIPKVLAKAIQNPIKGNSGTVFFVCFFFCGRRNENDPKRFNFCQRVMTLKTLYAVRILL